MSHYCSKHTPTQEEDDRLFTTTGFRFLLASARGFPYPWCAKKSKKGWLVRDFPPAPMGQKDTGVQFVGWRVAEKMFREREILLQRVDNRTAEQVRDGGTRPSKKRTATESLAGRNKVSNWFRTTQPVAKAYLTKVQEEEFQSFLRRKNKQLALEKKDEEQKRTIFDIFDDDEHEEDLEQSQLEGGSESHNVNDLMTDPTNLTISPLRRKHKKMTPKRNQHYNSIILGEDPALDQMIWDIVLEFAQECHASGVDFDGSAVSALREAAKDSLNSDRGHQNMARTTSIEQNDSISHGEEVADNRISSMIKELIGEMEQDSGYHFDGLALEALTEAAKELVS